MDSLKENVVDLQNNNHKKNNILRFLKQNSLRDIFYDDILSNLQFYSKDDLNCCLDNLKDKKFITESLGNQISLTYDGYDYINKRDKSDYRERRNMFLLLFLASAMIITTIMIQ